MPFFFTTQRSICTYSRAARQYTMHCETQTPFLRKRPMERDWIQAMLEVVLYRGKLGRSTFFHHISLTHSTKRPTNTAAERLRYERMEEQWGSETNFVLRLNQKVDRFAKATKLPLPPLNTDMPKMPAFIPRKKFRTSDRKFQLHTIQHGLPKLLVEKQTTRQG